MFSDKPNVNILTQLLLCHNIRHAVVCPGSRNAPLAHNLNEAGLTCFPVTDERSAGFIALGIALLTGEPVVVCVTSGTAVSNLLPAITEAWHRHAKVVVVSADRPQAWINQLDGQTINQPAALQSVVKRVANLPEPTDKVSLWHCNRLINDALLAMTRGAGGPVHINVPITEPLYNFSCESLGSERVIVHEGAMMVSNDADSLQKLAQAKRPIIILGQTGYDSRYDGVVLSLQEKGYVVLRECLASGATAYNRVDEMLGVLASKGKDHTPDFVLYAGDNIVSKKIKSWLRSLHAVPFWRVSNTTEVEDVAMTLTGWVEADAASYLQQVQRSSSSSQWQNVWAAAYSEVATKSSTFITQNHSFSAVKTLLSHVESTSLPCLLSSANSLALRYTNILSRGYVFCNRGTNGIEGSLSMAVGLALASKERVMHITGDLSFFYDQNALWQQNIGGNLRILLLNNGGGGIFSKFEGLRGSAARERLVMAEHGATAQGVCQQYGVEYKSASTFAEIGDATRWLVEAESNKPMLLEVFSEKEDDMAVLRQYSEYITKTGNGEKR